MARPSILQEYWQFLRHPCLEAPIPSAPPPQVLLPLFQLYCVHLWLGLLLGLVIRQVIATPAYGSPGTFEDLSGWGILWFSVVAIPVLEELLFRLVLVGQKRELAIAGSVWLWWGVSRLLPHGGITMALGTVLIAFNTWAMPRSWSGRPQTSLKLHQRFPAWVFYGSAIAFGFVHLHYDRSLVWFSVPLLILPRVVLGSWLGFMRLRYGFRWSVLSHGLYNGSLILPYLLFKARSDSLVTGTSWSWQTMDQLSPFNQLLLILCLVYIWGGLGISAMVAGKTMVEAWRTVVRGQLPGSET